MSVWMTKAVKAVSACCFFGILTMLVGCGQRLSAQQQQLNIESFDYVWQTIADRHWDPELGGLDWEGVRSELRPQVEQADTMSKARVAMSEMIARLEVSHFGIIPQDAYEEVESSDTDSEQSSSADSSSDAAHDGADDGKIGKRDGRIGVDIRVLDGQAVVTYVQPGSAADQQGVRPGWVVAEVEGRNVAEVLSSVLEVYEESTLCDLIASRSVSGRLAGGVGDTKSVVFLDGDDQRVELTLTLAQAEGKRVKLGHLPASYMWFKTERRDDNVGYIAFNGFMDPANIMSAFAEAMQSYMDCTGVIIDIRGNPGGIGGMSMGMAGWFFEDSGRQLGIMTTRQTELKFVVFPRPTTFTKPVAILIDGLSASTSEIFAGGMKDTGRARVFGKTSAGAALPSVIEKLPNGDGFQYAIANYVSDGGDQLEGKGVQPDEEIVPTREALLAGRDLVLDRAVEWIQSQ